MISSQEFPDFARDLPSGKVYRYQPYRIGDIRHLLKAGELRFREPREFNDPWDCRPRFYAPRDDREARLAVAALALAYTRSSTGEHDRRAITAELSAVMNDDTKLEALERDLTNFNWDKLLSRHRVLCLSAVRDDALMWGHYADGHRGICLIFDTSNKEIGKAQRVKYSAQYPPVPPDIAEKDFFSVSFLNKADRWEHEHEYRIVAHGSSAGADEFAVCDNLGYVSLGATSLIGIIRGQRMRDHEELNRLVASACHYIEIHEARTRHDGYGLDIVQIK